MKLEMIGFIAATLTTLAFLPQVIKAHTSKHTKDLSLLMYGIFSTGLMLWIVYGAVNGSLSVVVGNVLTLALSLYLVYLKIKYG
ncbi:MAG TPA: SemiSWEET transporter [Candidatus Omnitrophota bacterium]|nr:SemiSWEET transporter [Candidatus Omnitrophota bacterium]